MAQNLAQNPGFESGNTSGWLSFGPTTISAQSTTIHSGSYAGLVQDRADTWHGIAQPLLGVIQPGQPCNFSAWVQLVSGTSQTAQMTVKKVDGNGTGYAAIASGTVSTAGWTHLAGQYTLEVSGTLTELTLYLEVPTSTNAAFYVDDLIVEAVSSGSAGVDGQSIINWQEVHQRIDGFGASSAWRSQWTSTQADMLFSTNSGTGRAKDGTTFPFTGIGLSLLRTRVAPGGTTVEQTIMQLAQARGARVWSAPWSPAPAAQFKSNGSVNGGSFIGNAANYQAYANQLAGYVVNMKNQYGVTLYALSVQNEPDAKVTTYESCNWTAQQIHDFIPYLSSALVASNVGATRIMLPESQNWTDPQGLRLTTMNDPAVASLVGIIANHNYVPDNATGDQTPPAALTSYGKALWQTEVAKLSGSDSSIDDGLYWARRVHLFLTAAEANAWHYWWLYGYGVSNGGLCDTNEVPARRMYTLGNFSRFVRPGFFRIGSTNTGTTWVSAYRSLTNNDFAIVAINSATNAVTQTFCLTNFIADSVTPWITSASLSLASQAAIAVTNRSFSCLLPSKSAISFVGQISTSNSAPTEILLSNAAVPENQAAGVAVGTFATTDPDSSNIFTYGLVSGAGSTDNGSFTISGSNLLSAASFNYEAQSSFSIRVRSTDQGGLYVENAFTIAVTNINEAPSLTAIPILSVGAGVATTITNVATDPDIPAPTLAFSLLSGPVGSTLDPTNGVFSWRPLVSQAGSTNLITVVVTDGGIPILSATNSFTIMVDPLAQPALSSITMATDQLSIVASGPLGPDYTLVTSTDLITWQPLLTTNPAATPFSLTDTNLGDPTRFYRIQLGP